MMKLAVAVGVVVGLALAPARTAHASPPVVKLVSRGSGPRHTLRLSPPVGASQTVVMTMKIAMDLGLGPYGKRHTELPATRITMSAKVVGVTPAGARRYKMSIDDVKMDGAAGGPLDAARKAAESMKGLGGTFTMSSRDTMVSGHFDLPANLDPQIRASLQRFQQSIADVSVPFPAQAIGVGARWRAINRIQANGVSIRQVVEYKLVARRGSLIKIAVSIRQHAGKQRISSGKFPAGAKVTVESWSGAGKGALAFDLANAVMPSPAHVALRTGGKMSVAVGGQRQHMSIAMDADVGMK